MNTDLSPLHMALLAALGAAVGVGKLLNTAEQINWRSAFGRAVVTGALSTSATLLLIWIPEAPMSVVFGCGAALASLGTSAIENVVVSYLGKKG